MRASSFANFNGTKSVHRRVHKHPPDNQRSLSQQLRLVPAEGLEPTTP